MQALPQRFIPACAGNSDRPVSFPVDVPVHPRVCGEQYSSVPVRSDAHGSSPRVRGTEAILKKKVLR